MSTETKNTFSSYELQDKEQLQGLLLTSLQRQVIHNMRTGIAEEKLVLTYDPKEPQTFVQQEAYLRGQLDAFTYLLDSAISAEETLATNPNFSSTTSSEE